MKELVYAAHYSHLQGPTLGALCKALAFTSNFLSKRAFLQAFVKVLRNLSTSLSQDGHTLQLRHPLPVEGRHQQKQRHPLFPSGCSHVSESSGSQLVVKFLTQNSLRQVLRQVLFFVVAFFFCFLGVGKIQQAEAAQGIKQTHKHTERLEKPTEVLKKLKFFFCLSQRYSSDALGKHPSIFFCAFKPWLDISIFQGTLLGTDAQGISLEHSEQQLSARMSASQMCREWVPQVADSVMVHSLDLHF